MTTLKIDPKLAAGAAAAMEPHIQACYDDQGKHLLAVIELKHLERTEVAEDEERDQIVRMRVVGLEVPRPDQEANLRDVMRSLYLARTATGTLDEAGAVQLDANTLKLAAGILNAEAMTTMRAGLVTAARKLRETNDNGLLSASEHRHEVDLIADLLESLAKLEEVG